MKIVSLTAENVKRLSAVFIKPNGNLVEITGKNGQGKTSVLDAIWWAIAGTGNIQAQPIRDGEQRATIKLDLGEIIVTRTFTRKDDKDYTTNLSVRGADGSAFKGQQGVLDGLAGALSFDPLAFSRMKPKEQFDALRPFVPGIDFEKVDAQNRGDYERRTEANRMWKQALAAAEMISIPADTPEEPIDEKALTDELKAAGLLNQDVERRKGLRAQAAKDVETYRDQAQRTLDKIAPELEKINQRLNTALAEIDAQIATLQKKREELLDQSDPDFKACEQKLRDEAAEFTRQADELQGRLNEAEPLPELVDVDAIAQRMNDARLINANVERMRQREVHRQTAEKYEQESDQLTINIEARNQAKREAIAKAKMPVAGLDFGDGVVLLNGVPFEQASDAERLRTSVAIAMAANPKLRVIRVRDGSLLDEDSMRILAGMCDSNDFQCWIETVDGDSKDAFVIVEGRLREAAAAERSAA
jgi:DNA repair exonuclease SbcCD ATPase subunit